MTAMPEMTFVERSADLPFSQGRSRGAPVQQGRGDLILRRFGLLPCWFSHRKPDGTRVQGSGFAMVAFFEPFLSIRTKGVG